MRFATIHAAQPVGIEQDLNRRGGHDGVRGHGRDAVMRGA